MKVPVESGNYQIEVWVDPIAPGRAKAVAFVVGQRRPRRLPDRLKWSVNPSARSLDLRHKSASRGIGRRELRMTRSPQRTWTWEDLLVLPPYDLNDLPGEWWPVFDTPEARELTQELHRELPDGHVLKGRPVTAVAARRHLKDTVFWLPETSEWAFVHLTWGVETDPGWPSAFVTGDWDALIAEVTWAVALIGMIACLAACPDVPGARRTLEIRPYRPRMEDAV
jgi:hypothetical protein